MERAPEQVMQGLQEMEAAAEDILADKQQSIQLDKRRQQTREALRALQKQGKTAETEKAWVCFGNMFIKMPKQKAKVLLDKDYDQLDNEIAETRTRLKHKVNRLRDIESKDELKGFDLKALSKEDQIEVNALI